MKLLHPGCGTTLGFRVGKCMRINNYLNMLYGWELVKGIQFQDEISSSKRQLEIPKEFEEKVLQEADRYARPF